MSRRARSCSAQALLQAADNEVYDSRNNCNAIIETESNTLMLGCKNTKIPGNVTSIGEYAFECCSNLTSIEIPGNVTSIGSGAFYQCTSLASVKINKGVTSIGVSVFEECSSLASINIPDSVTEIGWDIFYHCSSLTSITWNGMTYSNADDFLEAFSA